MRVLIVGAGAIGSLLGAKLALKRHFVTLVARPAMVEAVRRDGLRLVEDCAQLTIRDIEAVSSVAAAFAGDASFDLAIFAMKAYDVAEAVAELGQATSQPPTVLTLQNGVGSEECVMAALPSTPLIAGSVTTPVEVLGPGVIEVSHARRGLGLAPARAAQPINPIADVLRGAGFQVRLYTDYRVLKWSKLIANMVGNATSAILDMPPAEIFADAQLFRIELAALIEALAVMRRLGVRPAGLPGYPLPRLVSITPYIPPGVLRPILRRIVAGGRGRKLPSLYLDLVQGRGRSEVAFLNGAVVRYGREVGIATPVNHVLTETLCGLVEGRLDWAEFRSRPERLLAECVQLHAILNNR